MITIKIEDQLDGTVKIVTDPPVNVLVKRMQSGMKLSAGESMAVEFAIKLVADHKRAEQKKGRIDLNGPGLIL